MSINDKIKKLAELQELERAEAKKLEDVQFEYRRIKNQCDLLEEEIRQDALDHFYATGDKNPHDAVSIKKYEKKAFNYDKVFERLTQYGTGEGLRVKKDQMVVAATFIVSALGKESKDMFELDETSLKKLSELKPLVYDGTFERVVEYGTALKTKLGEYLFEHSADGD